MSDTAQAWVWQHSRTKGTARLVLLALARDAAEDGTVRMGTAALMRLTNSAKGATLDGIARAVALGELDVREPAAGSRAALYRLPCPISYSPVCGPVSRPQTPVSGRETGPQTSVAVGKPDHKPLAVGKPDHKAAVSGRETGPQQLDLTDAAGPVTRAQDMRAQASFKAFNYRAESTGERASARRTAVVPEFARPLVDRITASGVIVKWALAQHEWFALDHLIQRSGVDMLAAAAVKAAARSGDVSHARYFLSVWRDLPPAPADGTTPAANVIPLASRSGYQPFQCPPPDAYANDQGF